MHCEKHDLDTEYPDCPVCLHEDILEDLELACDRCQTFNKAGALRPRTPVRRACHMQVDGTKLCDMCYRRKTELRQARLNVS